MTRAARCFGLLSVSLLAFAAPARAVDLEKFFPKDTDLIMSFNIEQILGSDLFKKYALDQVKDAIKSNTQVKEILDALGLDPLKDFTRIHMSGSMDPTQQKSLIVVEGKFDAKKINSTAEEFIKNSGEASVEKVKGKTAFKFTPPNSPVAMYAMVADSNFIVVGTDKTYLESSLEAIAGTRKSELPKEVSALLSKADPKASMFMVANAKDKLKNLPIPGAPAEILDSIDFFAIELRIEKDVKLSIALGLTDDDKAKNMHDQLKQGLQQAKAVLPLFLPKDPRTKPIGDIVAGIKTTQKGKVITLSADVSADAIEIMLKGE